MDQDVANALPPLRNGLYWRIRPRIVMECFKFVDSTRYVVVELMDGSKSLNYRGMWETLDRSTIHKPIPRDYVLDTEAIFSANYIRVIPYTPANFAKVAEEVWDEYIRTQMRLALEEDKRLDSLRAMKDFIGDYHPKENND